MPINKDRRHAAADRKVEQAAEASDHHTVAGRERAAKLLTQANAIKRGEAIPPYARINATTKGRA